MALLKLLNEEMTPKEKFIKDYNTTFGRSLRTSETSFSYWPWRDLSYFFDSEKVRVCVRLYKTGYTLQGINYIPKNAKAMWRDFLNLEPETASKLFEIYNLGYQQADILARTYINNDNFKVRFETNKINITFDFKDVTNKWRLRMGLGFTYDSRKKEWKFNIQTEDRSVYDIEALQTTKYEYNIKEFLQIRKALINFLKKDSPQTKPVINDFVKAINNFPKNLLSNPTWVKIKESDLKGGN